MVSRKQMMDDRADDRQIDEIDEKERVAASPPVA